MNSSNTAPFIPHLLSLPPLSLSLCASSSLPASSLSGAKTQISEFPSTSHI